MRKSRFSEEQIIHALKEHEAGTKTSALKNPLGQVRRIWELVWAQPEVRGRRSGR